jgi:glutaredoxin 3
VPKVRMYCTRVCIYCRMAGRLFGKKGIEIERIQVDDRPERRREMVQMTGRTSVPQIFIGDRHVGGYLELASLDLEGELDAWLGNS